MHDDLKGLEIRTCRGQASQLIFALFQVYHAREMIEDTHACMEGSVDIYILREKTSADARTHVTFLGLSASDID